jgi:AbrB family looped-hinge helix DNA binding protein
MTKVTAKYQITIPLDVRKGLGIMPGMEVEITNEAGKLELIVNPMEALKKKWRGKFKGVQTATQYMEEIRGKIQ